MKKFTIKNFFFLMGLMLFASALNAQSTIYVKGDVMGGDGTSWATAFQYLDDAVAAAQDGDQIWVAAGTYIPGGAAPTRDTSFSLKNGVDIYGGFAGTESMLSERDFVANVTRLSGDIDGDDGDDDFFSPERFANCTNVIVVDTTVQDAIFDGFIISNGHTDTAAMSASLRGGGMLAVGSPTVRNCIFESNMGFEAGGGVYITTANADGTSFEDCTFRNNFSEFGGGMLVFSSDMVFSGCTFTGNSAIVSGGGLYLGNDLNNSVDNCTFTGNNSNGSAGAFRTAASLDLSVTNCRFTANTCNGNGGAISFTESVFTADQITVDSNDAAGFGGGVIVLTSDFTLSNSEINSNIGGTSTQAGGGMIVASFTGTTSTYLITNTTFALNSAPFGGALSNQSDGTEGTLDNVTFTANSAQTSGGSISNAFAADLTILNSEFNGNNAMFGGAIQDQNADSELDVFNTNFENNSSTSLGGACILSADAFHAFDSCTFISNVCSGGFGGGISYQPDSFVTNVLFIEQCEFFNNNGFDQGGALNVSDGDVRITNSLFNFNKVQADPMSGDIAGRGGFLSNNCGMADTSRVLLVNNTIANHTGDFVAGISQWEADSMTASAEVVMVNNIFFTPYGEDYAIEAGIPQVISLGGNQSDGAALADFLTETNDAINVPDFGFVDDLGEVDFNLLATSVLRDKAIVIPGVTPDTDINGDPRGAAPDIGAYEYQQGVNTRPEIGDANSLQLMPNPAIDYTQVTLTNDYTGEVTVRVSNVLGQTISLTQHDKNTNEYQFELNTAQLIPGLYEISLEFSNQVVTRKLMKR